MDNFIGRIKKFTKEIG